MDAVDPEDHARYRGRYDSVGAPVCDVENGTHLDVVGSWKRVRKGWRNAFKTCYGKRLSWILLTKRARPALNCIGKYQHHKIYKKGPCLNDICNECYASGRPMSNTPVLIEDVEHGDMSIHVRLEATSNMGSSWKAC